MKLTQAILNLLVVVTGVAAPAHVFVFDGDPFLEPTARLLQLLPGPDWTSEPTGLPTEIHVRGERFAGAEGLVPIGPVQLGPPPAGTQVVLANQLAPDVSLFSFAGLAEPPPVDADHDGLPDDWEERHFGGAGATPDADSDGDGFTNLAEFEAGSDPGSATSRPEIPGVVARWSANGSTDDSVAGHHARWVGESAFAAGRFGEGFHLRGGAHLAVPDAPDLRLSQALSLAAWVRLEELSCNLTTVLGRASSQGTLPAFALVASCQGPALQLGTAFATAMEGPSIQLATNVWYHLAGTWDGTTVTLYLNGKPAHAARVSAGASGLDSPAGRDFLLGGFAGRNARATVDELIVANRALTAQEVGWLAGGNGGTRTGVPISALLVERQDQTLWRLNSNGTDAEFITHGFSARAARDRQRLVFMRGRTEAGIADFFSFWERDLVSGVERPLFTSAFGPPRLSFDLAPDGQAIISAEAGSRVIERRELTDAARTVLVNSLGHEPTELAVGPGGQLCWVAKTLQESSDGPWLADSAGSIPQVMPGTRTNQFSQRLTLPAWSPDGSNLAFKAGRNLIMQSPGGAGRRWLTDLSGDPGEWTPTDRPPAWSPDGSWLVTAVGLSGGASAARLWFVPTVGNGAAQTIDVPGAPVAAVVVAAAPPTAPELAVRLTVVPPEAPGGQPRLRFELPEVAGVVILDSAEDLLGDWTANPTEVVQEGGRRFVEVPFDERASARFYRVRVR